MIRSLPSRGMGVLCVTLWLLAVGHATSSLEARQAAAKPAAAKPAAAKPASPVDKVIELAKAGMSEDLIIRAITKDQLHADLSSDEMLKLKRAGVTDKVIGALMDAPPPPASVPVAAAVAPASMPAVVPAAVVSAPAAAPATASLRRAAIDEFDWATVHTSVQAVFGTNIDVGKGIRALLTKRVSEAGKVRIVERAKIDTVMKEQDFGASNRVKQGTNARIGQISGADLYLMGDIVAFGRDDRDKRVGLGGFGFGGPLAGVKIGTKTDKAIIVINYRMVDAETSEIIDSGEARGESVRKSKGLGGIFGWSGGIVGGGVDMTSKNFAETIIGEAVMDATDKLAEVLNTKATAMPARTIDIEARVADLTGHTMTIAAGSNQGVQVGQRYEVFRIISEIKDPVTGEVLDNNVERLGELVIATVRERIASGQYAGAAVSAKTALVRLRQ